MSGFLEPSYLGENAGKVVEFKPANQETLFAAAIWDDTVDRASGEVYEGFSLILHLPNEFIKKSGHHRSPIFFSKVAAQTWNENKFRSQEERYQFILRNRYIPELKLEVSRSLVKGWERRVAESRRKHDSELEFAEMFESLGSLP